MLISTKATDTIYQAVLHLLKRQGIEENEPLTQHVLLRDAAFLGYRFQGASLHVNWLAQTNTLVVVDHDNNVLCQEKLSTQKTNGNDIFAENRPDYVAA